MTLLQAGKLAREAAESAELDADINDTVRLLAAAVAELARALDTRLKDIERGIANLEVQVRNGR